jgi:ABC-type transport system involved in cytochrome bd biosynthesis fused ATPase/permease subunit
VKNPANTLKINNLNRPLISNPTTSQQRRHKLEAQNFASSQIPEFRVRSRELRNRNIVPICKLISGQYPLVVFHGDVGAGKTATAECIANCLARESRTEDSPLFKLSNRARGSGKVGRLG